MEEYIVKEIPREKRLRSTVITLVITLGLTAWVLWYLYSQQQLGENVLWILPFFLTGLWVSYRYWRTTEVKELTPEAKERKTALETEAWRKQEEFENRWYVRYPMAGLMLWGAWYMLDTKPGLVE